MTIHESKVKVEASAKSQPAPAKPNPPCDQADNFEHLGPSHHDLIANELEIYYEERDEIDILASDTAEPGSSNEAEPSCTCEHVNWGVHENTCPYKNWKEKQDEY